MFSDDSGSTPATVSATDPWSRALERLATDLLILTRVASVYPDGHPGVVLVAQRLRDWMSAEHLGELSVGFTPTRLYFRGRFYGTPGSRCESLAALFHERKLMRMTWAEQIGVEDVKGLARVLSGTRLSGADLRSALRDGGVFAIDLEPLEADRIHAALTRGASEAESREEVLRRGLEAWVRAQESVLTPSELAAAFVSEGFWSAGASDRAAALDVLLRQLDGLPEALRALPGAEQEGVRGRLRRFRGSLGAAELVALVIAAESSPRHEEGAAEVLQDLEPKTVVELMAELVAREGGVTSRLELLLRRLAPQCGTDELLGLVEAKLSSETGVPYAREVWDTIKAFLSDADEERFFAEGYGDDLEEISAADAGPAPAADPLEQDANSCADWIAFELARGGGDREVLQLRRRLLRRLAIVPVGQLLSLAVAMDECLPAVLAGQPELVREIFDRVLTSLRFLDAEARRNATQFAAAHEAVVLDLAVTALIRERRIAGRRFLVELLGALSEDTTPRLVQRAGDAPWYVMRNVAAVLGIRKERESAPVLEALLRHPHWRVREQALRSMSQMGGVAVRIVEQFAADPLRQPDERRLAKRLLARRSRPDGQRPSRDLPAGPEPALPDPPDVPGRS